MKIKLLSAIFAGLCSFALFADVQLNNEQAAEYLKKAKETQSSYLKFSYTRAARIGTMNITSFAQVIDANNEITKEAGFDNKQLIDEGAIVLGLWWWGGKFWKEAADYAFKVDNPRKYYIAFAYINYPITDQERYNLIKEGFLKKYNFGNADKLLTAFNTLLTTAESLNNEAETKATLQKLNRIYTPLLVNQKDKYEKLVAAIRLAIQTY